MQLNCGQSDGACVCGVAIIAARRTSLIVGLACGTAAVGAEEPSIQEFPSWPSILGF